MIILDSTLVMMILPIILKPKWGGGGEGGEFCMMYVTNILIRLFKEFSTIMIVMCINFHTVYIYQSKM